MMNRDQAIAHIQREMKRRELTDVDVAIEIGLTRSYISKILNGHRVAPDELLALFGLQRVEGYELKARRSTK